ncbi:hypothetical protein ABZX93_14865 [Streptomyces sp. NPDC006632]|uniref:hypothetical protein n=1 Tax=Streptomyces sp. NPDC006632 TaxID=3157182 RepID=UPI0033A2B752
MILNVPAADKAVRAAERRSLDIPATVRDAAAVDAAVTAAMRAPDPERPAVPATASDVAATVQQYALDLQAADLSRRAAERFHEDAALLYAQAVFNAVPGWIAGLQKEFATLTAALAKAAAKLPAELEPTRIAWNNPAVTAPYQRAEGIAVQLDQLVADRADIVAAAGGDGGRDNALFAVATLPEPTEEAVLDKQWPQLAQVVSGWRELRHQHVARWVYLARQPDLTLGLATPGEVRQRAGAVEAWRNATHAAAAALTRAGATEQVRRSLAG